MFTFGGPVVPLVYTIKAGFFITMASMLSNQRLLLVFSLGNSLLWNTLHNIIKGVNFCFHQTSCEFNIEKMYAAASVRARSTHLITTAVCDAHYDIKQ